MANLMICDNGHVTDPDADLHAQTGKPLSAAEKHWRSEIERGGPAWRTVCRQVVRKGPTGSGYSCRAAVVLLELHPVLETAWRLGGQDAVNQIIKAGNGRRPG